MGLMAGFLAAVGLLCGLALLALGAGVLERWIDETGSTAETLDSLPSADERETTEPENGPVTSRTDRDSEADRSALRPAA
jgi:hypothetical protein